MLNETLSLSGSLYLFTIISLQGGLFPLPMKISRFCSLLKNPKILFPPSIKGKNTIKQIVYETTKVNITNLLRDKIPQKVS